ncbi:alpha/beta fold hydrolase BchO [Salibaculum griseiflavum]|uniref:Magnesium chelatase n=1 Tax=Salibaculum griseiflavum TaxID=1914409 RepID=A0A2V1NZT4_9RHOB|nr:alpha/beta fold hydrolase BchO [Salibaculum griseiflavum]PWG15831.1 magnesium chelatase [Salibaculum griseiflavum]
MDWARDLADWPNSAMSRRIVAPPHQWHVQEAGTGYTLLLLHGAGGSTHSWRDLLPILAKRFHVVAPDLPGQGFTRAGTLRRCGLDSMTEDIKTLCAMNGWHPRAIVSHSAGSAIALRLSEMQVRDGHEPSRIIGLNPALGHFEGIAGWLFPAMAKLLALNPLTSRLFSAGPPRTARAARLIESTGSRLGPDGLNLYARLIADRDHVEATLQMMSQWHIDPLLGRLDRITSPCLFLAGARDTAVPPRIAECAATRIPDCKLILLPDLGHLAHEEDPKGIAALIEDWLAAQCGVAP